MLREHTQKSILWQPAGLPGVTLLRGECLQQRLARHAHEEYALGVVTRGGLGFQYRRASHIAGAGEINIVVPGEVHTGHPEIEAFWSYRTFYIAPEIMREVDGELGTPARSMPFFAAGVLKDPELAVRYEHKGKSFTLRHLVGMLFDPTGNCHRVEASNFLFGL